MGLEYTYTLERYTGRNSRYTCPKCGQRYCFSRYVDTNGNYVDERVGRCDHESSCGYHKRPKEFFEERKIFDESWKKAKPIIKQNTSQSIEKRKELCIIPNEMLIKSVRKDIHSTFTQFLHSIFTPETISWLIERYKLGVTKSKDVIYFQVDVKGRVRTGKIMKYDPSTGKRIKDSKTPFKINWVHSVMKHSGVLPKEWELTQCLFGEHLLSDPNEKGKTVALVESEKTAIIASALMPKYIWLATGGKSQLKSERLSVLKGRRVIAFPDVDGYQVWSEKLSQAEGFTITVSDVLEKNATDKERYAHIDIADWLIKWRADAVRKFGSIDGIPTDTILTNIKSVPLWDDNSVPLYKNPNFRMIAEYFSPEYHRQLSELIDALDLVPTKIKASDPI